MGFNNTAIVYSISENAKLEEKLGWIISQFIKKILEDLTLLMKKPNKNNQLKNFHTKSEDIKLMKSILIKKKKLKN